MPARIAKSGSEPVIGSPFITIRKDHFSGELTIGTPVQIIGSPPSPVGPTVSAADNEEILSELASVFTDSFAYDAYIPLCKLLGQFHMDEKLLDNDLLHEICVGSSTIYSGDAATVPSGVLLSPGPRFAFPRNPGQRSDQVATSFTERQLASNLTELFGDVRVEYVMDSF